MLCTGAGHSSRENLASLGDIASEHLDILVIYILYFFRTESAELPSLESSLLQGNSFLLSGFSIKSSHLKWLKVGRLLRRPDFLIAAEPGILRTTLF